MAKVEYGSSTITSSGLNGFTLADSTLQPQRVVFWVTDSSTASSAGFSDLTNKFTANTTYGDVSTSKALTHYRNVSGTKTKIIEFDLPSTSFDYAGEFYINITTLVGTPKLYFAVHGV